MRKSLVVAALALSVVGCNSATPDPGQEAVIVRKPLFFGHGGVSSTPVKTGRSWFALSTQVWYVPTVPIQFGVHFEDLMSKDGVPLDFDAALRLQITDSVKLASNFSLAAENNAWVWYTANVEQPFRNFVRQEVRKHGMNETAIDTAAIEQIDRIVSEQLSAYFKQIDLPVRLVDLTVGRANPPDAVKNQRIATAEQEQRANTEKQRKLAEDQRLEAERARAQADNAYRNAMNLSPEQFISLEAIHMQNRACQKQPCTFVAQGINALVGAK